MHRARWTLGPVVLSICAAAPAQPGTCSPVLAAETTRAGVPANPVALLPGLTSGPVLGAAWDPGIDHTAFAPAATLDALVISAAPASVPLAPFGTVLCDFASPTLFVSVPAGRRFAVPFPHDCRLNGLSLYTQGLSADASSLRLTNALDLTIGTVQPFYTAVSAELDARLRAAGPPSAALAVYSSQDFTTRTFVRNPSCWAAGIDLTGVSPWNQAYAQLRAGTLVSPRHVVFAQHYPLQTAAGSNEIAFVTAQNVTVIRRLVGVAYPAADIGVGVLDAEVPPEITFYKVLPRDWQRYVVRTRGLPMLHFDQEEKALVRDMLGLGALSTNCWHATSPDPLRAGFSEALVGGDSGNPGFVVVGGEAVLVLTHWTASAGPFYTYWIDEVNGAMGQLGGGYQLTEVDLAGRVR